MEFRKICVLGLGYIGLPTASTFATHGLEVVGVDVNPKVVQTLRNGGLHIHEPGLRTLVQAALGSGNLVISEKPELADAFVIAVPTPFYENKRADMSYVVEAAEAILPCLSPGCLVVLESTSPPRTTCEVVAPILERSGKRAGRDFYLAYSPERVLPGQILRELIENDRVIGGVNRVSAQAGLDLYSLFVRGEIILTDASTAEMVKLMENTFRDVNIAIANEFSRISERFYIDVWEAISIANRHPRVNILNPGPGVGGHCIGVDPWFLVEAAPDLTNLIQTARQVNDSQPSFVVNLVLRAFGIETASELEGKSIAALGLAYKPDVDDLRESPAIEVVRMLSRSGAEVYAYEPYSMEAHIQGINIVHTLEEAVSEAQLILLLVDHKPFREMRPEQISNMTKGRLLVDATNALAPEPWESAGFSLYRLGASTRMPLD